MQLRLCCIVTLAAVMVTGMAGAAPLMYMGVHPQHSDKPKDHSDLAAIALFDVVTQVGTDGLTHNYLTIQLVNASATPCRDDLDILMSMFFALKSYEDKGVTTGSGYPVLTPVSAILAPANPDLADDVFAMWEGTQYEPQATAASALLRQDSVLKMWDKDAGSNGAVVASAPADLNDKWGFASGLTGVNALDYFPSTPTPYYAISCSSLEGEFDKLGKRFDDGSFGHLTGDAGHGLLSDGTVIDKDFTSAALKDWFVVGSMLFTFQLPDDYILDLENDIVLENEQDEYGNPTRSSVWFAYRQTLNGDKNDPVIRGQDVGYVPDSRIPEPMTMSLLVLGGLAMLRRRK